MNNLRMVRNMIIEEQNIKMKEFLKLIGISKSTWYDLEGKEDEVSVGIYRKIVDVFGYDLIYLINYGTIREE